MSGSQALFTHLYEQCSRALFGRAYTFVRNGEDAEDIVQMAFLKFWQRLPSLSEDVGCFSHYLLTTVSNQARDHLRSRRVRANTCSLEREDIDVCVEWDIDGWLDRASVVLTLCERQRAILTLTAYGYSQLEIGVRLGINEATVRRNLHRARKRLETRLGGLHL